MECGFGEPQRGLVSVSHAGCRGSALPRLRGATAARWARWADFPCSPAMRAALFTARLPTAAESTDYGRYYHDANLEVPPFVRRRLDELVSPFDADRRLNRWLDVGCGAGTLMQAVRGRGWDVIGTEVAERAAEEMRAKGFERKGLEQLDLPEASFDVVSSIEVVEHVADVNALLGGSGCFGGAYLTTPTAAASPPSAGNGLERSSARRSTCSSSPSRGFARRSPAQASPSAACAPARSIPPSCQAARAEAVHPASRDAAGRTGRERLPPQRVAVIEPRRVGRKEGGERRLSATRLGDTLKLVAERPS